MNHRELVALLQDLVEVSKDGEMGFGSAAEYTASADLRDLFRLYAADCAKGVRWLESAIQQFGGEPKCRGSMAGALHRRWMNIKRSMEGSERCLLEECERGEGHAKSHFAHALTEKLPPDIRGLVQRLHAGTVRHHDRIRQLRDEARRRRGSESVDA